MTESHVLLLTDVVDSTEINDRLGDDIMGPLWEAHDHSARELMRRWHARELGRSDGFLILFASAEAAVGFALDYHRLLAALNVPLKARVGVHVGPVSLRENSAADMAQGALPFEVDGVALPVAARVMSTAMGGQTLLTAAARQGLGRTAIRLQSHGHWRLKGVHEPIELFEIGDDAAPFVPPPDTTKAYRVVRVGDDWMPARELPHNLPADRDLFVGRQDAVLDLARRLDDSARLVSLLGIGGIGKTRLALRYARAWLGDYPGGAWFCDLAPARSLDGIVHAVAQALDVPLGNVDPVQQLGAAIAGHGSCLVILDNFEQVVRHAEQTVGIWLERAPAARFIVTSREVLGIVGEHALPLAPLVATEAVQLFRHRVRAAGLDDPAGVDDEAAITSLVELLDRLPLAIELAAARVRVMSPRMLLQRMDERFRLLASSGGRRDRQATLRATLDWSWDLLSVAERSALAQLSVFEGGFTVEAAEAVVDLSSIDEAPWVIDVVQSLVEKSLARRAQGQRFDILRTVQDYAAEQLVSDGRFMGSGRSARAQVLRRHWTYFGELDEVAATADRCIETENLMAACQRALELKDFRAATKALAAAWTALRQTGPFRPAGALAQQMAQAAALSDEDRATIDWVAGQVATLLGDTVQAEQHHEAGLARSTACGHRRLVGLHLCGLAEINMRGGQHEAAETRLGSALAIAHELSDTHLLYQVLNLQGSLADDRGRYDEAVATYTTALALARESGNRRWEGGLLGNLGLLMRVEGRLDQARELLERALSLALDAGDRKWEGNTRCNLGLVLHELGLNDLARTQFESALSLAREMGHARLEATVLCNLGLLHESIGEGATAREHLVQSVAMADALADVYMQGEFRIHLARALVHSGDAPEALRCLASAAGHLERAGDAVHQGVLHCVRVEALCAAGDLTAAQAALDHAKQLASTIEVKEGSEFALALVAARGLFNDRS